ncbi:PH domain-like protein [Suhomyces tanzawaensis NRRL Y-17324]|uniref:PH domain-like protein n=1 Tax=Suhomyces tanzawaensis NRRL Y-17324 TaxID=984487 RepID=A0A1E4SJZ4_9ASCO|nr:PH domain-like protein [Suhomyces tanzawaensis NRRL Y-17324]ODV79835.1 PH domain-like protein [Suhomyces tanzawaensis NRRL Y-17324]
MSEETSKRKLDDEEHTAKRQKSDEIGVNGAASLQELRSSILAEVHSLYEARITSLESKVAELLGNKSPASIVKTFEDKPRDLLVSEGPKLGSSAPKLTASKQPEQSKPKATFGASLFSISASVATPTNSFNSTTKATETPTAPNSSKSSPQPVFGATTSFGKSLQENLKNRKNVFDSIPSQYEQPTPAQPSSSFGANSKFGNAFQESLKKKSFLDEQTPDSQEGEEKGSTPQQFKQVELEKIQNIQTGEEDEESKFNATAKLFELDLSKISEGWKERGLGPVHLNQSTKNKNDCRIVMRSNGLLRVILNYKITPESKLLKGLEASLTPGKFVRLNSANAQGLPIQYLLKFGSEATRNQFYDATEEIKKEIGEDKQVTGGAQWL